MYKKYLIFLFMASAAHALDMLNMKDSLGLTPLNVAALSRTERKELNMQYNEEITEKEYDARCTSMAALLLFAGADSLIPDKNGINAIQRAEKNKDVMPKMYELIKAAHVSDRWNSNPQSGLTLAEFQSAQAVLNKYR